MILESCQGGKEDLLVNASNTNAALGSGVSGAIPRDLRDSLEKNTRER